MKSIFVKIEIPSNSYLKYEFSFERNNIILDRLLSIPFPCNYGYIPNTLSDDGDPLDILLYFPYIIETGCEVEVRMLGVLNTEDEHGYDPKIICIPVFYNKEINNIYDIPDYWKLEIENFYKNYKLNDKDKWCKIKDWDNEEKAYEIYEYSLEKFNNK